MLTIRRLKTIAGVALLVQAFAFGLTPATAQIQVAAPITQTQTAGGAAPPPTADDTGITIFGKRRYSAASAREELAQSDISFACAFMFQDQAKKTGRKRSPHTGMAGASSNSILVREMGGPRALGTGASETRFNPSADDGTIAGKMEAGVCDAMLDDPRFDRLVHDKTLKAAYDAYDAKDYATALRLLEAAYDKLSIGVQQDPETYTFRYLTPVAVLIGRMYFLGQGTPPDTLKAIEWLKKAALAHYTPPGLRDPHYNDVKYMSSAAEAAVSLARIYQFGAGVPVSASEARRWYMRAAELDYFPAIHMCGLIFQRGYGGEKNIHKAIAYFTRAGEAGPDGYGPSQYALGEIYYYGDDGVQQDKPRAGAWLLKAARNGIPDALYAVGRMYELGEGGAKVDPAKALLYYKEAAVKGQPDAQLVIGTNFYLGVGGLPKDLTSARHWFLTAAENGNPDAMFNLAVMMVNGEGGPKDLVRAYCWFYIADKGGVEKAKAAMTEVAGKMTPEERAQAEALLNPKPAA